MYEILPKQELYKELEKLKFENVQLRNENLFLHKHLADMADFTQELIGMDEIEKILEEDYENR